MENIPYQFVTKDSSIIGVLLSANSVFDSDGRYICSLAIITDITDKNRAEKALKESEDKFKYLFDYSVIGKSSIQSSQGKKNRIALEKDMSIVMDQWFGLM